MKKILLSNLLIFIALIIFLELSLKFFYFKEWSEGENCREKDANEIYFVLRPNCQLIHKSWEKKEPVKYFINEHGRRDYAQYAQANEIMIASFGDSFTFGAMSDIQENYNYLAIKYLNNELVSLHNYGVAAQDAEQIISKIENVDHNEYKYILYGLTANDLYPLLDHDKKNFEKLSIKNLVYKSSILKFAINLILKNDDQYILAYLRRGKVKDYLKEDLSNEWKMAYSKFELMINNLPAEIKQKLIVVIIPQQIQTILSKKDNEKSHLYFEKNIKKICLRLKIDCLAPDWPKFKEHKRVHFTIDSHLNNLGNQLVAKNLSNFLDAKLKR